jgi:hypothetical protein
VLNDLAGSAWLMIQPGLSYVDAVSDPGANIIYYYGDASAHRRFIVLAVDISQIYIYIHKSPKVKREAKRYRNISS